MTEVILKLRERKKQAARARIVDVAVKLFAQHGLEEVTVEQIAASAEVGKGTIYNYFRSKEEIVVAFMTGLEKEVQTKVESLLLQRKPAAETLTDLICFQFELKKPYHRFVRVFFGHMFNRTEEFFPHMVEMQRFIDPPLERLFLEFQQRGEIDQKFSLPELVLLFKTAHMGLSALWAIEGPPFHATSHVVQLEMRALCEGLKIKKP
jgi:AcrR family transcriptional regulator